MKTHNRTYYNHIAKLLSDERGNKSTVLWYSDKNNPLDAYSDVWFVLMHLLLIVINSKPSCLNEANVIFLGFQSRFNSIFKCVLMAVTN